MKEELPAVLEKGILKVTDLRDAVTGGEITDGPVEIHERLLKARHAQDQTEEIVAALGRLYSQAQRTVATYKAEYVDAEAQAHQKLPPAEEYSTKKERDARLSLATLDEQIVLRRAEQVVAEIKEAVDYCTLLHRGIDSTRRDYELRTRLISLQGQLDR